MAEPKTKPTDASVEEYLNNISEEGVRNDCWKINDLMEKATGSKARMWGTSIVGYGSYHYKYSSGTEADWPLIGFSPRKQNLTLYVIAGFETCNELLSKLGKHTSSKSCLYIKKLSDVNLSILSSLIENCVTYMKATYPPGKIE